MSCEHPMQVPARGGGLAAIKTFAEEPEAMARDILDAKIIAGEIVDDGDDDGAVCCEFGAVEIA